MLHFRKMSEEARERSPRSSRSQRVDVPKWKRYRSFAVGIGYCGTDYQGLQFQPDIPTVERDVQAALVAAGLVDPILTTDEGRWQLFWTRAARTDKGVHACANVISCRLDSDNVKIIENSIPVELDQDYFVDLVNAHLPPAIRVMFVNRVTMKFDARTYADRRYYEYLLPKHVGDFTLDIEKVDAEMKKYVGTHNFHNFTKGLHPNDKQGKRHIVAIITSSFNDEFFCVRLFGQSFLLNQIRKMISLAIEVSLALAPADAIDAALKSKSLVHTHMVPGDGLLLDRLLFPGYDRHKCGDYSLTTPFNWLVADEESDGDAKVMARIFAFKTDLIQNHVLPGLKEKFDEWMNLVIIPNSWESRHSVVSTN
jgi:tRNA pseudouridine38-40 synthase